MKKHPILTKIIRSVHICVMLFLAFTSVDSYAQKKSLYKELVQLPLVDSLIQYEEIHSLPANIGKERLINIVAEWMTFQYNNSSEVIKVLDKPNGLIVGNGITEVNTGGLFGSSHDVRYTIKVDAREGKYRITLSNFLEVYNSDKFYYQRLFPLELEYFKLKDNADPSRVYVRFDNKFFYILHSKAKLLTASLESFVRKSTNDKF